MAPSLTHCGPHGPQGHLVSRQVEGLAGPPVSSWPLPCFQCCETRVLKLGASKHPLNLPPLPEAGSVGCLISRVVIAPLGRSDRTSLWGASHSLAGTIPSGATILALGLLATMRDLGFSSSEASWPLPGRQCCLVVRSIGPWLGSLCPFSVPASVE